MAICAETDGTLVVRRDSIFGSPALNCGPSGGGRSLAILVECLSRFLALFVHSIRRFDNAFRLPDLVDNGFCGMVSAFGQPARLSRTFLL